MFSSSRGIQVWLCQPLCHTLNNSTPSTPGRGPGPCAHRGGHRPSHVRPRKSWRTAWTTRPAVRGTREHLPRSAAREASSRSCASDENRKTELRWVRQEEEFLRMNENTCADQHGGPLHTGESRTAHRSRWGADTGGGRRGWESGGRACGRARAGNGAVFCSASHCPN